MMWKSALDAFSFSDPENHFSSVMFPPSGFTVTASNVVQFDVSLQTYLTEFLQQLSQSPFYGTFSAHHNDAEKQVLATIGIQNT